MKLHVLRRAKVRKSYACFCLIRASNSRRLPSLAEISDPDAMYHSLHTNLPKEVMQFRDFPFSPDLPSFIPRAAVQR